MNTQVTTQEIDIALAAADKIADVLEASYTRFYERNDASLALATALCSGTHMIMFGKPGTTKTALGRYYGKSLGVTYYYQQLNGATQEEALFGPISMEGIKKDIWTRKWASLAKAHIAFLDEAGKASNLVQNLVLGAMQERVVTTADDICYLPLHTMISGSNETIDENPAFWDRWTLRVLVNPIQDMENFSHMLVGDIDDYPVEFDPNDLPILRKVSEFMARQASQEVILKLIQVKSELSTITQHYISDRRWKSTLNVAAGNALLNGCTDIDVSHLHTAKWLLWEDVEHISKIYNLVERLTNEDKQKFLDFTDLVKELESKVAQLTEDSDSKVQAVLYHQSDKMLGQLAKKNDAKWNDLKDRLKICSKKILSYSQVEL